MLTRQIIQHQPRQHDKSSKHYSWKMTHVIVGGLAVISSLNFAMLWISKASNELLITTMGDLNRAHNIMADLRLLEKTMIHAESGEKEFVITGKEEDLAPYTTANNKVSTILQDLNNLVSDPEQKRRLEQLPIALNNKLQEIEKVIAIKRKGDQKQLAEILASEESQINLNMLQSQLQEIEQAELKLLEERQIKVHQAEATDNLIIVVGGGELRLSSFPG